MIQLIMIQQKDPKSSVRADKESHLHWTMSAKIVFFPKECGINREKKTVIILSNMLQRVPIPGVQYLKSQSLFLGSMCWT